MSDTQVESVEHGVRALLIGTQILADAVQADNDALLLVPLATGLRPLLRQTRALAGDEDPDLFFDLEAAHNYLEESIHLIDGGFKNWMTNVQVQGLLATLKDLSESES